MFFLIILLPLHLPRDWLRNEGGQVRRKEGGKMFLRGVFGSAAVRLRFPLPAVEKKVSLLLKSFKEPPPVAPTPPNPTHAFGPGVLEGDAELQASSCGHPIIIIPGYSFGNSSLVALLTYFSFKAAQRTRRRAFADFYSFLTASCRAEKQGIRPATPDVDFSHQYPIFPYGPTIKFGSHF